VIQQIDDDLKMEMRGPATVFLDVANVSEHLAAPDAFAGLKRVEGTSRQVSIEGEEFRSIASGVTKNHERAVVEGRGVDGNGVNDPVERRVNWRAG